jgi:dynein heavy chain 2
MEMIQKSMEGTVEKRREVEHLQLKLGKEEVEMTKQKAQVEEELRGIQPVLDAAKQAVGGIKKDNLTEIPSLKMPPAGHPRRTRGRPQDHGQL